MRIRQLAFGLGRPSLIQDFDCDFHTPSPPNPDVQSTGYGELALFVHLARIAGDIHRLLYSPEAARSSTQTYLQNVERCEAELDRWRASYLPAFPAAGIFRAESELPAEAFDNGFGNAIRPNLTAYMYLLCNVRRAIPVFHALGDGTKVAGTDQKGVEIAISLIRLSHLDKQPIDPYLWFVPSFILSPHALMDLRLSIYRAFTCGTILYQSLNAKAILNSQDPPVASASDGARRQLNALRILEGLLMHKVRGYTGAAQYFAKVIRGWIDQFENIFNPSRSSSVVTPVPSQSQQEYFGQHQQLQRSATIGSQHGPSLAVPQPTEQSGSWSSPSMQHFAQYFSSQSAPLPSPNAPAAAAFSAMYSRATPVLSLATASNDFQGAYNWVSPGQYAAYGYGPDPPSAVAEHTDFSGAEMFDAGGGYGGFEVGDLMMPAWIPLQTTMPEQ